MNDTTDSSTRTAGFAKRLAGKAALIPFTACLSLLLSAFLSADSARGDEDHHPATQPAAITQTMCPVTTGNKIDPNVFTVYRGKKVYFCCAICKGKFQKDPEKHLGRLPQFGGHAVEADGEHADHDHGGFSMAALIRPSYSLSIILSKTMA